MKKRYIFKIIIYVSFLITFSIGFWVILLISSLPPGCINLPIYNGCFSKSLITNLSINPLIPCINFEINNCNYPLRIIIINKCNSSIIIQGEELGPNNRTFIPRDFYWSLNHLKPPKEDEFYKFDCSYEKLNFTISFVYTKELC